MSFLGEGGLTKRDMGEEGVKNVNFLMDAPQAVCMTNMYIWLL